MAASSRRQSPVKRLISELSAYQSDPNEALERLGPVSDDDLFTWTAVLLGVTNTPYEGNYSVLFEYVLVLTAVGGRWLLDISIPQTYPLTPPTITFRTHICHPNVNFATGEICLDLLKSTWVPTYTVSSTLTVVQQLLTSAEPDSPLNVDVALLYRQGDLVGAESLIRYYTRREKYEGR